MTELGGLGLLLAPVESGGGRGGNVPISVVIGGRQVTNIADVTFSATAPGGFETCRIVLTRAITSSDTHLIAFADVTVYDTRHAGTVWQGRLTAPGKGGVVSELTAVGLASHLDDRTVPLAYIDSRVDTWDRSQFNNKASDTGTSNEDDPKLEIAVKRGTVATVAFNGDMINRVALYAGLTVANVRFTWDAGVTDADWQIECVTRIGNGAGNVVDTDSANTAGGLTTGRLVADGGSMLGTQDVVSLRLNRITSSVTVANDSTWITAVPVLRFHTYSKAGVLLTSAYNAAYVTPDEVVSDLLGRLLTKIDGASAYVAVSTLQIDQMVYEDGATSRQVLDDLIELLGDWAYYVWEKNITGKATFTFGPYPTTISARVLTSDMFEPPSGYEPFNRCAVRWKTRQGRVRTTVVTSTVPELTAAGLTREMRIDLGDARGSASLATTAGQVALARSQSPSTGGSVTISRPLFASHIARTLLPHELPRHLVGELIEIADIPPASYTTPVTGRNGQSVFRVADAEYDSASNSCKLALDASYRLTSRMVRLQRRLDRATR